ncbi:unnamed protein product [Leptidea sinapis]|uniref:Uncharacterized protein n=1 Tax=Leptidea sinapis TaxID=189913 RepID=A0A5E4QRF6_9NEOP|nr:unnamed protein product [Leptidea sinapis]
MYLLVSMVQDYTSPHVTPDTVVNTKSDNLIRRPLTTMYTILILFSFVIKDAFSYPIASLHQNNAVGYNENNYLQANGTKDLTADSKDEALIGTHLGCCYGSFCANPCVYPYPMVAAPQVPVVVHARTFFEPVQHDHPPLGVIKDIIKADKIEQYDSTYSDNSEESSDTEGRSDTETDSDY